MWVSRCLTKKDLLWYYFRLVAALVNSESQGKMGQHQIGNDIHDSEFVGPEFGWNYMYIFYQ